MEIVAAPPVWSQSGSELLARLDTLKAAAALIKTEELQIAARLDEMGTAQELGARDTAELLSLRYRVDRTDVRKDLAFAVALPKYSAVTAALPAPADPLRPATISPDQAKVIVTTLEKAPSTVPVEHLTVAEEQMIEAARLANPRELTRFAHKVLATLDTDGPEPAEDEARTKESLRLRRSDGGVKFNGFLAGDSAELLETQIHKLSKPHKTIDGELDPRPRDNRQADALRTILDAAAGNPDYPGVPHLTVTIDFNDLKATLAAAPAVSGGAPNTPGTPSTPAAPGVSGTPDAYGTAAASGVADTAAVLGALTEASLPGTHDGSGAPHAFGAAGASGASGASGALGRSAAVGELVFGGNLSAAAVRLIACDAAVLPIILGGDSQPLDIGTEQRFVNRYLRRALNKRDKGCVICQAPPWMCHAHHLTHWADGGPTSLHNLALLCALHHRAVHTGQWTLTITQGVVHVTRPTWADPPPMPDPAKLAEVITRLTPPPNHSAADTSTHAGSGVGTSDYSGNVGSTSDCGGGGSGTSTRITADSAGADKASAGNINASSTGSRIAGDSWARGNREGVGSDPTHQQPGRLPAASTAANPTLSAAREALRARLLSLAPNHSDPWSANATAAAGP